MVRRKKIDVLSELPPKTRQIVRLNADRKQKKLTQLELEIAQDKLGGGESELESDTNFTLAVRRLSPGKKVAFDTMAETRQEIALAKLPLCYPHIEDALTVGPVVVFAHHRAVIDELRKRFLGAAVIHGGTSLPERDRQVKRFQAGKTNLFIGNIQAAGVGITLTKASHVIFIELDWVPAMMSQAEDRCHRIGQKENVLVQHLVFEGSLDAMIAKSLIAKQNVIDQALDEPKKAAAAPSEVPLI